MEKYKSIFRVEAKATEWAADRIQVAFEKVAKDEARKLSTVQEIMHDMKHRFFCGASSHQQEGKEALRCHICAYCNRFPMENYVCWVSGGKSIQIGGVRSVEKNDRGHQTGSCWCKQAKVSTRPRSSKRMRFLRASVGIWLKR